MNIALIGNPNCGKTTLYNALTGEYKKTGNWTGVTVDKTFGKYIKDKNINIVDLPGIYSLNVNSVDEKIAIDYIKNNNIDCIINVVDGTSLERSLFLTCNLQKYGIPTVIAINMCDDLEKNGIEIDTAKISKIFNMPTLKISALKKINLDKLIISAKNNKLIPTVFEVVKSNIVSNIYNEIEQIIAKVTKIKQTKGQKISEKIDLVLLNKYCGIPIFFIVLTFIYFFSMQAGGILGKQLSNLFQNASEHFYTTFLKNGVPEWLCSLTFNGVVKGVGSVFSFLPQILILFFLLSIIEESGYASRIAFLLDRVFNFFGLNGKAIIPLVLSCGCTVSGFLATRTIEDDRERRLTIFLLPFMPCGAKTAVFAFLSYHLFNGSALVASSTYFLSILCVVVLGKLMCKNKKFGNRDSVFFLEMPTLRIPPIKNILHNLLEKTKDFTLKAGSIIFLVSVFMWGLKSFCFSGYTKNIEESFLFMLGRFIKYVFYPLGFGNEKASVSLLCGIFAKESIVESLEILSTDFNNLFSNSFSAYSYFAFILLSPPCIASLSVAKGELGKKWFIFMICFQFIVAYIVSFLINLLGIIYFSFDGLILSIFIAIIILLGIIFSIKKAHIPCSKSCTQCKKVRLCKKK